jgi:uncharacterized phage-associated protein
MIDVIKVASYIYKRYQDEMNTEIDEMKLHKLLYLSQRESIIRTGQPMFSEPFAAWKYGPVIVKVRDQYKSKTLNALPTEEELAPFRESIDFVFKTYAPKDSWTLSILTHGESSWQKAREGYGQEDHCDVLLDLNDIKKDAERMKMRRFYFDEILPQLKENN